MAGFQPANYQTKAHLRGYSELGLDGLTLKLLWILRALPMRRIPFVILWLAVLVAVSAGAPAAHAAKTRGRASSAADLRSSHNNLRTSHNNIRSSHNKQKAAAHKVKRARTRSRRAVGRVRPAVLRRRYRAQPAIESEAAETESTDQLPAVEEASLKTTRVAMPLPLVGSHESLARQNDKTEADNLERIEDEDDLSDRIARKMLVPVPASAALTVNGNLPENHRYCRPWTARFLADLARVHAAQFHRPLEVSSAVRTVEYQKRLMETNGNAAAAEGDVASPHLTGATIDIAKQGLSRQEVGWMRSRLLALEQAGKIDVEEEFQQSCFHITVYKSYVPPLPAGKAGQPGAGPQKTGQGRAGQRKAGQPKTAPQTPDTPAEIASRGR